MSVGLGPATSVTANGLRCWIVGSDCIHKALLEWTLRRYTQRSIVLSCPSNHITHYENASGCLFGRPFPRTRRQYCHRSSGIGGTRRRPLQLLPSLLCA